MNIERQAKVSQVKEISEKLATTKALVIAEYAGLTVKELQDLRKELKASGVEIKVYKNRLFKLAAREANLKLDASLVGPNIYAFGMENEIAPAKILTEFAKKHQTLKLKAGTYEGKVIDAIELAQIAALPSLEEALTRLAMSMLSPLKYIAMGLNMLATQEKLEVASIEKNNKEVVKQHQTSNKIETQVKQITTIKKSSTQDTKEDTSQVEESKTTQEAHKDVQATSTLEQKKR